MHGPAYLIRVDPAGGPCRGAKALRGGGGSVILPSCVAAVGQAWSRASAIEGGRGVRDDARYAVSRECADLRVRVGARGPCLG